MSAPTPMFQSGCRAAVCVVAFIICLACSSEAFQSQGHAPVPCGINQRSTLWATNKQGGNPFSDGESPTKFVAPTRRNPMAPTKAQHQEKQSRTLRISSQQTLATSKRKTMNKSAKSDQSSDGNTKTQRRKRSRFATDNATAQRNEMLSHEILTREEEFELGTKVVNASKLRKSMSTLIDDKNIELQEEMIKDLSNSARFFGDVIHEALRPLSDDFSSFGTTLDIDDLHRMSIYGMKVGSTSDDALFYSDGTPLMSGEEIALENYCQNRLVNRQQLSSDRIDDLDDHLLTDDDILIGLDIPGGRVELRRILLEGAYARDRLIRNNIRLVVSIAKKWANHSAKSSSESVKRLVNIYGGGWDHPSLDEAIQEGIIGLARAADRFDPDRGLRFSTYATHWVTSYVRICFQSATTGSLHVPSQLHEIKSRYNAVLKSCYDTQRVIPSELTLAEEVGVPVKRLRAALRFTQPLLSIDAPMLSVTAQGKGSAASGDSIGGNQLLLSDTLQCTESKPEYHVELSFLRQSLENAMAAELSPHERDVIRLRLGLDDGVSRSVREVVEVCGGSVSQAEVRSAEQRAYKKLRAPYSLQNYKLLAYLDFAGIDYNSMDQR